MRMPSVRFLRVIRIVAVYIVLLMVSVRTIHAQDICYITNIDAFLEQCPTNDPAFSQILSDFTIKKDGIDVTGYSCVEPVSALPIANYTDELILLQGLRTIYYMDKDRSQHLPWTSLTLYDWLKSQVAGFNIDSRATHSNCCSSWPDGLYINLITSDDSGREHDKSWLGIAGNIGLLMHEARHVDGFHHTSCCPVGSAACDQRYDETNLSPYGIQYWLEKSWLDGTLHTGFTCLSSSRINSIKNWLRGAANKRINRFCEDPPPYLDDSNNMLPPCDLSCAPINNADAINLSARAKVGVSREVLNVSVVIVGSGTREFLVTAKGPSMAATVPGTLDDPVLRVVNIDTREIIAEVNDWQDDPAMATRLIDLGFAPTDPREAAAIVELSAGSYTLQVLGFNGTTGIGQARIREL